MLKNRIITHVFDYDHRSHIIDKNDDMLELFKEFAIELIKPEYQDVNTVYLDPKIELGRGNTGRSYIHFNIYFKSDLSKRKSLSVCRVDLLIPSFEKRECRFYGYNGRNDKKYRDVVISQMNDIDMIEWKI
jgi:hypothetical protein